MPADLLKTGRDVLTLLKDAGHACAKDSDGGRKITPAEWLTLGQDLGIVSLDVVEDVAAGKKATI